MHFLFNSICCFFQVNIPVKTLVIESEVVTDESVGRHLDRGSMEQEGRGRGNGITPLEQHEIKVMRSGAA